ncbi:glycosyltransferase family 2 protein [Treponema brennaborense]|uniref:Glycosyl transferase family 2 n=1 Tax=Treponema brennaborense (strain DSM 12168 / CIP 105900 / DD5/3) TaxID=906968 RepID=F4LIY2_TREBD|nr:glycosyltransferase [Treponema brennaborense]AEE17291.1 glycosyl transferase family 2 [Treponema brennaborense DSM 12168]
MSKKNKNSLITIVVPIYNSELHIHDCITSIQSQSYDNIEIILVDDGSLDKCPEICDFYANKDSRIHVVHKNNEGSYQARKTGLQNASGEYIAFIDSDDWIAVNYIEELYRTIKNSDADIASCDAFFVHGKKKRVKKEVPAKTGLDTIYKILEGSLDGYTWLKLIRTNLLRQNNFFDIGKISLWEDILFSLEAYYFSNKIAYVSKPLYYYRFNYQSLCNQFSIKSATDIIGIVCNVELFLKSKKIFHLFEKNFNFLKARAKTLILIQVRKMERKNFIGLFPESNQYIYSLFTIPFYNRLEAYCYLNGLSFVGDLLKVLKKFLHRMREKI